jgi:hypothetical protein
MTGHWGWLVLGDSAVKNAKIPGISPRGTCLRKTAAFENLSALRFKSRASRYSA